jgi:hypothetical protein
MLLPLFLFCLFLVLLFPGIPASHFFLLAAVAAPLLCCTFLCMSVVALRGPLFFWYLFWISPTFRFVFVALAGACLVWTAISLFQTSRRVYKLSILSASGNIFVALGAVCVIHGLLVGALGFEEILTTLNNEMAVLPLSLSKVLGITTHLNIDPHAPFHLSAFGCFIGTCGWLMRKKRENLISSQNRHHPATFKGYSSE